jgi:excinuclease UvrABC ATPase subunit
MRNRRKVCDYKYYVIRGQVKHADRRINTKENDKFKVLIRLDNIANSVNLWNRLKESLENKIEYENNKLNLLNITENEFITVVNKVYEERKDISIDESDIED